MDDIAQGRGVQLATTRFDFTGGGGQSGQRKLEAIAILLQRLRMPHFCAISQSLTETQTGLRADRTAHELSCEAIRSILSHPDGRRRRTRTVRAHLRGCEGCREWARRRGKRTGIGAFLPAPIATLARWLQPILGSDPGTAALAMRTPGIGAARTIGLIASLAAGTAGLGAGGAQSHRVAPASRAVPAPTQAHVTQRRWVATAPGASYVSSRPVVELRPTATGPAVAYSAARAAAHTKRSYPAARAALAPQRFPVAPRPAAGPAPTRAEPRATPAAASENDSAGRSPTAAATPTPGAIAFGPRRGGQVRPRPSRAS